MTGIPVGRGDPDTWIGEGSGRRVSSMVSSACQEAGGREQRYRNVHTAGWEQGEDVRLLQGVETFREQRKVHLYEWVVRL